MAKLKEVDVEKNPGLAKLPEPVRNKMGYAKKGGLIKNKVAKKKVAKKKVAKKKVA
jgi:hypothetical protein